MGPAYAARVTIPALHDAQQGGYTDDLAVYEALADLYRGPILELGAGTGRVAGHLAHQGRDVTALDIDSDLIAALAQRYPGVRTMVADVLAPPLSLMGRSYELVLAPTSLIQIVGGLVAQLRLLTTVAQVLSPTGAAAIDVMDLTNAVPGDDVTVDGATLGIAGVEERTGGIVRLTWRGTYHGDPVEPIVVDYDPITAADMDELAEQCGLRVVSRMALDAGEFCAAAVYVLASAG
jgi:SAM-dependent methyltransferase